MTRFKMPPFSRRGLMGAGAASLLAPTLFSTRAYAQAAPAGGNNGPAINVSGAQNAPIPIAIAPFTDSTGIGQQIAGVLSDDLSHSGLFRTIDPASFVPNSVANGIPVWQNWHILGAQVLVTGAVTDQGGGQLRVEFRLWNVGSEQQVQGTAYTTTAANWRRIGHIIGDVVYQQLIGEKGYFNSRVAYISEAGPATGLVRRLAVMDYDGANNQFLTDGLSMALSPEYNPTRQQLAFVSYEENRPRVFLFDLQNGATRSVGSFGQMTIGPRFSPDGNSLLMSVARNGGAAIVRVDLNGGGMEPLTDAEFDQRHPVLFAGRLADRLQFRSRRRPADLRDECQWRPRQAHQLRSRPVCRARLVAHRRPYRLYLLGAGRLWHRRDAAGWFG